MWRRKSGPLPCATIYVFDIIFAARVYIVWARWYCIWECQNCAGGGFRLLHPYNLLRVQQIVQYSDFIFEPSQSQLISQNSRNRELLQDEESANYRQIIMNLPCARDARLALLRIDCD
jgi:hypothetical protein